MRGALAVVLLTIGFYWKLSLTRQYVWFDHPDMCYLEIPRLQFMASEIHLGRFPLWDPHIWMGQPLIGQTQPGPLNPLNLLFVLLPLRDGNLRFEFLNWYYVLIHAFAALGAYALCRELRRSRAASILGACAYAFGGFMGSVAWLDVMSGAMWAPLICLFFVRAARGIRPIANAGLSGVFLGIAWLSGHHEIPLLTSLALAIAWLVLLYRRGRPALAPAAMTFFIGAMTGAAQLWPTWEFGRLAKRWGPPGPGPVSWNDTVSYLSSEMYSLPPRGLVGFFLPDQASTGDCSGFLGVVGVSLALIALASAWRLTPVRWLAALAGVASLYALGAFTPLHGLVYSLAPALHKARLPVRALHLVGFALALLAAYGADQVLRRRGRRWTQAGARMAGALGGAILIATSIGRLDLPERVVLCAWIALAFSVGLLLSRSGRISRFSCTALLLFLLLTELNAVHTRAWQNAFADGAHRFARTLTAHRDAANFLRSEPGPIRVIVNDQDVPANFGDLYVISTMEGYTAGVTENLHHFGRHTPAGQRLYGITHYVGKKPSRPDLVEAFSGVDDVKVFRVPGALPRARSVHEIVSVASPAALAPLIENPTFDLARAAILVGAAPALERCDGDQVEVAAYAPNRVRLRTLMVCRGLVVLSDTYYPGWRAFVDGRETRIWEAYGAVRGVVVEPGAHEVVFRFRPISVIGGMCLTAAGVLIALGVAVAARLRAAP